jgi:hypothetical protein
MEAPMSRILFLGLGAALMFFGDPKAGRQRRNEVTRRIDATRRLVNQRGAVLHEAAERTRGLLADARGAIASRDPNGPTLAQIGRDAVAAWQRPDWSPAQRALAGAVGAGAAMFGYVLGGLKGVAWCAIGGGLIARATAAEASRGEARRK